MTKHVDFYLSLSSPWTYLGWDRVHQIVTRHGAGLTYYPVDFGIVFPATGGLALPERAPARQAYRMSELKRWKTFLGVANFNPVPKYFPVNNKPASLMAITARERGADIGEFCRAVLSAVWCEDRDIGDRQVLKSIADGCGVDGASLVEAAEEAPAAECFVSDSQRAIERGVFGAPTFVYRNELFWGQDRLDFLDRALAGD